jgi:hypothetical protein
MTGNLFTQHDEHGDTIAAAVLAALVGLGTVGALLQAVLRATGYRVLAGLGLAGLALLAAATRSTARMRRERREDAADALAGAAWRALHLPDHPLTAAQTEWDRDRAGVS